jgi:polysaccharide biosynthesis transport protein
MDKNDNRIIRAQDASKLPAYYPSPYYEEPPFAVNQPEEEEGVNLLDYWRILVKRRWVIVSVVSMVLVISIIATWRATPIYRATVKLQIDPEQQNVLPFKEMGERGQSFAQSKEYLETQFKVLESNSLAERVIKVLDLENNPAFAGKKSQSEKRGIFSWFSKKKTEKPEDAASLEEIRLQALVSKFADSLTTAPLKNSRLVDVSFSSVDPKLAAEVMNTLAKQYIQMNFETKYSAANAASDFLAGKLIDLKARVEKSEESLITFSRQHDIYAISEKQNVSMQKLSDLSSALTEAQSGRIQKESIWNIVQKSSAGNFPEILRNDLVKNLEENVNDLRQKKTNLEVQFNRGWPALDKVTDQLAEAERELVNQKQRAVKNAETEYNTALQREQLLDDALEAQKVQVDAMNQNSIQYNILQRQVETDKQLYEGLLQRMKEAGVAAGLQSNNIHVVDPAQVPRFPSSPNKPRNLMLGLVLGLVLGVGLAIFIEHLDNSIKTPDDIDRYIALPSLGVIPALSALNGTGKHKLPVKTEQSGSNGSKEVLPSLVELVSHYDSKSLMSEAYRNLRASVLLSSGSGHPPKVLLVVSSQSGEGKTTSSFNIAITLAQTEKRVVLIDCDMRKPRVHRVLGMDNKKGMSSYLSGNSDLADLIQPSEIPNLFAIPAGPIPPNPAELVGSVRMKEGLESLGEEFDYIIIDSPPVLAVSDARILAAVVDGVILVIKGGETPKEAVLRAKRLLEDVHGHLIGTLLNNVDVRSADYYYYSRYYRYDYGRHGYGYGYGYGYGHENNEEKEIQA